MSTTTLPATLKRGSGTKQKLRKLPKVKGVRFGFYEDADDPWIPKRTMGNVYDDRNTPLGTYPLGQVASSAEPQPVPVEQSQSPLTELIRQKTFQFTVTSEIPNTVSQAITKSAQKCIDDLNENIRLMMSKHMISIPLVKFPTLNVPSFKLPYPVSITNVAFAPATISRFLEMQLQMLLSEETTKDPVADDDAWTQSAQTLLNRLESGQLSESKQRSAISYAESLPFSDTEKERLLTFYDRFIDESRLTEDDDKITVVCAAIRKYAMNMGSGRLATYARWLLPSTTARIHHDIELELSKGAYWHLRYLDVETNANLQGLQATLESVAGDYLKPRLMLDKNYASIAKFAILACVLIDARLGTSEVSTRLWSDKRALSMNWFDRLVDFELGKALETIGKRDGGFTFKIRSLIETLNCEGQ